MKDKEDLMPDNLKCPYCGAKMAIFIDETPTTIKCNNCDERPVVETKLIAPMEVELEDIEERDSN